MAGQRLKRDSFEHIDGAHTNGMPDTVQSYKQQKCQLHVKIEQNMDRR